MVLWEITLITAYYLGLKRTYRLALRLQRRLLSKQPKLRGFVFRRTRAVFDVALTVHRRVQQRDIDSGKSFGNRILRFLDSLRPSANIRGEDIPGKPEKIEAKPSQEITEPRKKQQCGGRNLNYVSVQNSDLYGYGPYAGVGILPGIYDQPRMFKSLPLMLLENYWDPLKKRIEYSQRRKYGNTWMH